MLVFKRMKKITLCLFGLLISAAVVSAQQSTDITITNLITALIGESNATHKYALYAKKAEEEGFTQVAKLFKAASAAEAIHRDAIKKAVTKLGATVPEVKLEEVKVGSTKENLENAIKGETYERDKMYPEFLKQARDAKVQQAVMVFGFALDAETEHVKLYKEALDNLGKNKETPVYVCPVCGYTCTVLPPSRCPSCGVSKEKFIIFN